MEIMESKASHESVYQLMKESAKLNLGFNCQWRMLGCFFNFVLQKSARKEIVCAALNGFCTFIRNMQFIMFIFLKVKAEAKANLFASLDSVGLT